MRHYNVRVLWFLPPSDSVQTVAERANMPNDSRVRSNNTCNAIDFLRAGIQPDYILKSSREETIIPRALTSMIGRMPNTTVSRTSYAPNEYQRRAALAAQCAHHR